MTRRIVWLASYPKSGNTWVRIFLSNLIGSSTGPSDLNNLEIRGSSFSRAMYDNALGFDTGDLNAQESELLRPLVYRWINEQLKETCYYKTHDACKLLSNGDWMMAPDVTDRVVYILRNPLDVAVSQAHFSSISIDDAISKLCSAKSALARQKPTGLISQIEQPLGTWSSHVESWVDNPHFKTHVVRYEDLLTDPSGKFLKLAAFLGLTQDEERHRVALHNTTFDKLQEAEKAVGFNDRPQNADKFFRNGKSGDWQNELSEPQIDKIIDNHGEVMKRLGYLNADGSPRIS